MSEDTVAFTLGLAGTVGVLLLAVIGYFMRTIHNDVKANTASSSKNEGQIELVAQRQEADIKRVEEFTQFKLEIMAEKVGELSSSIQSLVELFIADKKK